MPVTSDPAPARVVAPLERSIALRFQSRPPRLAWGASAAFLSGVLAAEGWAQGWPGLARVVVAWFVAVPLCGALWAAPREGAARPDPALRLPTGPDGDGRVGDGIGHYLPIGRFFAADWHVDREAVLGAGLALAIAAVLGGSVPAAVAAGIVFAWAARRAGGGLVPPGGTARSALEIAWPALIGWLALGGPVVVPAPLMVSAGALEAGALWWRANWLFPSLAIAFSVIHMAATTVRRREDLPARRWQTALGYVAAIALLAVADRPLGAGAVALAFVAQWPFQAMFESGKVRWHWEATQGIALAAMIAAVLGV